MCRNAPVFIGLPVYNGERFLREAIESVLGQNFQDFSLFISDNASSDATWEICQEYAKQDKRIILNRNETNIGSVANFRLVLERSVAPFFMWMAHDDILGPTYVGSCYEFLRNHADYVLCSTRNALIDDSGQVLSVTTTDTNLDSGDPVARWKKLLENLLPTLPYYGLMRRFFMRSEILCSGEINAEDILLLDMVMRGKFCMLEEVARFSRIRTLPADPRAMVQRIQKVFHAHCPQMLGNLGFWLRVYAAMVSFCMKSELTRSRRMQLLGITTKKFLPYALYRDFEDMVVRVTSRSPSLYHLLREIRIHGESRIKNLVESIGFRHHKPRSS